MDLGKTFYEFVIATLPAVLLYFIGWGYLYYFLNDFGISVTELTFDTPTIFIYAFPPIRIFINSHWYPVIGLVGAVGLLLVVSVFAPRLWTSLRLRIRKIPIRTPKEKGNLVGQS